MYQMSINKDSGIVLVENKILIQKKMNYKFFSNEIENFHLFLNKKNENNINFRIDVSFLKIDFALMGEFDLNQNLRLLYLVKLNSVVSKKKWEATEQEILNELKDLSEIFKEYFLVDEVFYNGVNEYTIKLIWGDIKFAMTKDLYHSITINYC